MRLLQVRTLQLAEIVTGSHWSWMARETTPCLVTYIRNCCGVSGEMGALHCQMEPRTRQRTSPDLGVIRLQQSLHRYLIMNLLLMMGLHCIGPVGCGC